MKTVVLLSGGLDSAVVLAGAVTEGKCLALGFDYGQPHHVEIEAAKQIAEHYDVPFEAVDVLPTLPLVNDVVFAGRNLVLASLAIARAQAGGYDRIAVGCNANDWLLFPDCRPTFWKALAICAEAYGIGIATPLIHAGKTDVVALARQLGVPIDLTWSCYSPKDGEPCEQCVACNTRRKALAA